MNISFQPTTGTFCLAGELEIYSVEAVRSALLDALSGRTDLRLDLRQVVSCDPAGAQLLVSTGRSACLGGKTLQWEELPAPILEAWAALGLPADFFTLSAPAAAAAQAALDKDSLSH